ncbi:aldehyde dehydrogenase family protein, partial [Ralstonia pickettii]|nr:aldehyde dehydrogenase family protein [Ralstonia pickettii]
MNFEKKTKSIWIDGAWRDIDGKTEVIYNPATLKPITEVAYAGKKETDEAIQAATRAFSFWSETTGRERSRILYKAYELMQEDAERLGEILTLEQGKPLAEAIGEVKGAAAFLLWYAEESSRGYGEWIPSSNQSKRLL